MKISAIEQAWDVEGKKTKRTILYNHNKGSNLRNCQLYFRHFNKSHVILNNLLMFKDTKFPKHILSSDNSFLYFVNHSTECFPLAFTAILHFNLKYEENQNLNSISPLAIPSLMCITYMVVNVLWELSISATFSLICPLTFSHN